jgi:hypothetical protein
LCLFIFIFICHSCDASSEQIKYLIVQVCKRALVLKRAAWTHDLWSIYLLDEGSLRLCAAQELSALPPHLAAFPAVALPVLLAQNTSLYDAAGVELEGILSCTDSQQQLQFTSSS